MELLKVSIVLFVIIVALFPIIIGYGLLQDYRKDKEIEKLLYGVAFPIAATLFLYLFFHLIALIKLLVCLCGHSL